MIEELGLDNMVLDGVEPDNQGGIKGTWQLYYVPSVNGIPIPSIREENVRTGSEILASGRSISTGPTAPRRKAMRIPFPGRWNMFLYGCREGRTAVLRVVFSQQ